MTLTATSHMLTTERGKPAVLHVEAQDATAWAVAAHAAVRAYVAERGALFVRGLELRDVAQVEGVFRRLGELRPEAEGFAQRRRYSEHLYSASQWPPNVPMCVHHALSYALEVPSVMLLACLVAPPLGGATPLADASTVLDALPAQLVERFEREGWLLTRNYNDEVGATLQEAFGTADHDAIERYCRANAIEFEWQTGGGLRTRQRRSAVVRHPLTGQYCWFNQIAFLNEWTLAAEVRDYLVDEYGADALPFNTCFGNGDPIGADVVEAINAVYEANTVREPWHAGDLLVVDNIRAAHGREPFEGPREVVVAFADGVRLDG